MLLFGSISEYYTKEGFFHSSDGLLRMLSQVALLAYSNDNEFNKSK